MFIYGGGCRACLCRCICMRICQTGCTSSEAWVVVSITFKRAKPTGIAQCCAFWKECNGFCKEWREVTIVQCACWKGRCTRCWAGKMQCNWNLLHCNQGSQRPESYSASMVEAEQIITTFATYICFIHYICSIETRAVEGQSFVQLVCLLQKIFLECQIYSCLVQLQYCRTPQRILYLFVGKNYYCL